MKERIFSVKKLAGIFNKNSDKSESLEKDIAEMTAVRELKNSKYWPFIESLLKELKDEAVKKLSQRKAPSEDLSWASNRLNTVSEFYEKLEAKIKKGDFAQQIYTKLKEKEDGRRKTG